MEYHVLATRLRKVVERYNFENSDYNLDLPVQLPQYPKVVVKEGNIVIVDEGGDEQVVEYIEDELLAASVADEIQLGLRAINYVRGHLSTYISKLADDLIRLNISQNDVNVILYEGYSSLKKMFIKLDEAK